MKEVVIPVVAAKLIRGQGGKLAVHCIVDDNFPTAQAVIDKWPDLPDEWKKDGEPLHVYFGWDLKEMGETLTPVEAPKEP